MFRPLVPRRDLVDWTKIVSDEENLLRKFVDNHGNIIRTISSDWLDFHSRNIEGDYVLIS